MNAKEVGKKAKDLGKRAFDRVADASLAVAADRFETMERNREKLENYDQRIDEAQKHQYYHDIDCAIRALIELNIKEDRIMQLLSKYFQITGIEKSVELIHKAKIGYMFDEFETYLESKGMSDEEVHDFFREHKVYRLLRDDAKILSYTPEKLYSYLIKHGK